MMVCPPFTAAVPGCRHFSTDFLEVFTSGEKLDWGCNLKPGDTVYVNIPSLMVLPSCRAAAVIRYVGGLPPQPGLMFGIEIMVG